MKSLLRFQRISPQKLRLAAKGLRGARVEEAFRILAGTKNRGGDLLARALRSALAGAGAAPDPHALRVERLLIDGGPILPRHRAMSMGRGGKVRKRSSHIRVELAPIAERITAPSAKETSPKSATRAKEA